MNNVYEEVTEKLYWSVGELSIKFGLPQSKIRFWDSFFNITTLRSRNNYRKFTKSDVEKLQRIKVLVDEGYHLKAIINKI